LTGVYKLPRFAFGDNIRAAIISDEVFDNEIMEEIYKHLEEGKIFLDVGANYGQMSVLAAKRCPGLKVYAFEAQRYVFELLRDNCLTNNVDVTPCYNLVGSVSGPTFVEPTNLDTHGTYGSNHLVQTESTINSDSIDRVRIDDLEFDRPICLMKIDVQGMDLEVLKGAEETIRREKMPIIFELERYFMESHDYSPEDFHEFFNSHEYSLNKINSDNYICVPR